MVDRVKAREVIFLNSAFFVLGFTFVFSMVGVLLQTVLSKASLEAVNTVRLIVGAFVSRVSGFLKRAGPFLRYFNTVSGVFLIAIGLLVVTNYIGVLQIFLNNVGPLGSLANPFGQFQLNFLIALSAGVLTFISPCILPLLPAFLAFVSGTSPEAVRR